MTRSRMAIITIIVLLLHSMGRTIVYSTYLGGDNGEMPDAGVAVDGSGRVHVAGVTFSRNFPFTPGAPGQGLNTTGRPEGFEPQDAFYSRLSADGSQLVYSTYLGGALDEWAWALAVDTAGNAYVGGQTSSTDFITVAARQPVAGGGGWDGWIARINAAGSYDYASYVGGDGSDILFESATRGGVAYLTGQTCSSNFPSGCGLAGWGWQDNGWGGVGVPGPTVRFAATGRQRMRVQTREDGFAIDQIVLSASRFMSSAPGAAKNDATVLPACPTSVAR